MCSRKSKVESLKSNEIDTKLNSIFHSDIPDKADIEDLLSIEDEEQISRIFNFADAVRKKYVGDGIYIRGIVEFSNICGNRCAYCGINKNNLGLPRFSMTKEQILDQVKLLSSQNIKTVVLQSGEDPDLDTEWLADIVKSIKSFADMSVTLSVGEKAFDEYKIWKDAGADRYLLKIETSNPFLYDSLHPGMSFEERLRCLSDLRTLGYETGSGSLIGLRGQTIPDIADDIIFFKKNDLDMIGIGPFIPHKDTELSDQTMGSVQMVLKTVALTRIVTKDTNIPATTALGSAGADFRIDGLKAGANVLMPNYTPPAMRILYELYPGKRCLTESSGSCLSCFDAMTASIGRYIDYTAGDRLKCRTGAE